TWRPRRCRTADREGSLSWELRDDGACSHLTSFSSRTPTAGMLRGDPTRRPERTAVRPTGTTAYSARPRFDAAPRDPGNEKREPFAIGSRHLTTYRSPAVGRAGRSAIRLSWDASRRISNVPACDPSRPADRASRGRCDTARR